MPPKTPLGKAIAYARNRYVPLGRFLEDGRVPVDNGEVERLIRMIALGRKNWLFLGSDEAGRRAASVYSLVLSSVEHGPPLRAAAGGEYWRAMQKTLTYAAAGCLDAKGARRCQEVEFPSFRELAEKKLPSWDATAASKP